MKEFWKTIGRWLGLAASSIAIWKEVVPLVTFPSPLVEALLYAALVGIFVWAAWNLCVSVCRGVPAVWHWLYSRTKRGRFAALRSPVESMIRELPGAGSTAFSMSGQHRLTVLTVELYQLGIAPPIEVPSQTASHVQKVRYYAALRAYLRYVHVHILKHDLKSCIEMAHHYREFERVAREQRIYVP